MLTLQFNSLRHRPLHILCIGAHSDDIEIGCGGTLLRLLSELDNVEVSWVVLGSSGPRDAEALRSAELFLAAAKKTDIVIKNFVASFFRPARSSSPRARTFASRFFFSSTLRNA